MFPLILSVAEGQGAEGVSYVELNKHINCYP